MIADVLVLINLCISAHRFCRLLSFQASIFRLQHHALLGITIKFGLTLNMIIRQECQDGYVVAQANMISKLNGFFVVVPVFTTF